MKYYIFVYGHGYVVPMPFSWHSWSSEPRMMSKNIATYYILKKYMQHDGFVVYNEDKEVAFHISAHCRFIPRVPSVKQLLELLASL